MELARLQISVQGQVQGVGFRPYIYRIANQLALTGYVQNNASGVLIEIQGLLMAEFMAQLTDNLPPLARVSTVKTEKIPVIMDEKKFQIKTSEKGSANTIIAPDTRTCTACLQELFDPQSRYFYYPFLNCTHCGPRFTITRNLPYDRCQTAMDEFPLCHPCESEYWDPENRRYHAQPTACTHCGPQLSIPVAEIVESILQGEIIAIKGLGGYQLLCDANNEATVLKLRARKNRESKPFALMAANLESLENHVEISLQAKTLLESPESPIVLLTKKEATLPDAIAPGLNHWGIMLPHTPLHYLLFHAFAGKPEGDAWLKQYQSMLLVVTSGNIAGEPLIIDDRIAH